MKIYTHKEEILEQGYESIRQALQFLEVTDKDNVTEKNSSKELRNKFRKAYEAGDISILKDKEKAKIYSELDNREASLQARFDKIQESLEEIKAQKKFITKK